MNRNRSILGFGLLCGLSGFLFAGCNSDRYVSNEEYLDTAMSRRGPGTAEIYGYVPPQETRAVDLTPGEPGYASAPSVIIIEDGGRDFDANVGVDRDRDGDIDDDDRNLASSDDHVSSFREFTSDVNRQMEILARDLAQLQARADIKGAAATAAVEPATRDLRMYREEVGSRMNQLRNVEDLSLANTQQAEIRELLREARESLNKAEVEVNSIPAVD